MEQKETVGTVDLRPVLTEGERVKEEMIALLKKLMVEERSLKGKERSLPAGFTLEDFKLYDPQKYQIKFNKTDQVGKYWTMWMKGKKCRKDSYIVIFLSSKQIKVKAEESFRKDYEYSSIKKEV